MKLYLAPLQSYTTAFYRKAHATVYGKMDKYFTPFFEDNSKGLNSLIYTPELEPWLNDGLNVVPQVASNQGKFVIGFAREMKKRGFSEININMGCPFPMLVKRKRGGGLLEYPELVQRLLDEYFSSDTPVKLSVKLRIGNQHPSEGETIINLLNNYPLEEIIIHPRLVTQKYTGLPDWKQFNKLLQLSKHSIIANGDINGIDDAIAITQKHPQSTGLMLGRGILCKPNLASEIKHQPTNSNNLLLFHEHYINLLNKHYNNWAQSFNHLQTFWQYPLQNTIQHKRLFRKLKKHNKPDTYQHWLKEVSALY